MTGVQIFSLVVNGITAIIDIAVITIIVRRWKKYNSIVVIEDTVKESKADKAKLNHLKAVLDSVITKWREQEQYNEYG